MRLVLALALVTSISSCAPAPKVEVPKPAPPKIAALASQAPADTRLLFRIGRGSFLAALEPIAEACETSMARDVTSIEGWATEKGEVHVAIEGKISVDSFKCMVHVMGQKDLGPARVKPREGGGVLLETKRARSGAGAPAALAARFSEVAGADAALVVLGPSGVIEIALRQDGDMGELRIRPGEARVASLAKALAPAREKIPGIGVSASKDTVTVRFEPRPEVAAMLRRDVVESFKVPSGSMIPTLALGDHFFVLKDIAGKMPARGEVVVYADEHGSRFVKRVVGVEGDRVQTNGDALVVNGKPTTRRKLGPFVLPPLMPDEAEQKGTTYEETLGDRRFTILLTEGMPGATTDDVVPAGHVFVMGDNRYNSHDSRFTGPVPVARVLGRPAIVYLPGDGNWERVLSPVE